MPICFSGMQVFLLPRSFSVSVGGAAFLANKYSACSHPVRAELGWVVKTADKLFFWNCSRLLFGTSVLFNFTGLFDA